MIPNKYPMEKHRKNSSNKPPLFWISLALLGVLLAASASAVGVSAHLENKDAFCASCHSQPESTFYQRSLDQMPVDMASNHHGSQVRCIDCHSGPGVTGRLSAISLGAGDLMAYVTHTDQQPAPLTQPIPDSNCLKCHADVPNTQDFNRHFHAFLSRWQAMDQKAAACVDCHSAHTTDGDKKLGFLQEQRTVLVCQACHRVAGD